MINLLCKIPSHVDYFVFGARDSAAPEIIQHPIDGLVQDCSNSIANAIEIVWGSH